MLSFKNLASFEESAIVTNATENETCLNCHHFPAYSSESKLFHARGANGGTILYRNCILEKISFNEIDPKKNTTYPAWSPDGKRLFYAAADAAKLPDDLENMRYHLLSVTFDPQSRLFGDRIDTLYNAHLDENGVPGKPFLLPQKDPRYNLWRAKSYNVPEFIDGKVELPDEAVELFETGK